MENNENVNVMENQVAVPLEQQTEEQVQHLEEDTIEETAAQEKNPLKELAAKATAEISELKDRLLRTAAEYENFRKRSTKEREAAFGNGVSFAAENLLPVLDALEMAAMASCSDDEYKKGVDMTVSKCKDAFKSVGIEEIDAKGQPFDPELHAAVQQIASDEPSGTVLDVYQKGYRLKDKIIRHSSVVVSE